MGTRVILVTAAAAVRRFLAFKKLVHSRVFRACYFFVYRGTGLVIDDNRNRGYAKACEKQTVIYIYDL